MENATIIIQKIFRGFLCRKRQLIPNSNYQTKTWRKTRKWYLNGKHNECELYQRELIELITKQKCNKTDMRINTETNTLQNPKNPIKLDNGFELTETFDGLQTVKTNIKLMYNLKFVCSDGGSQTRSLREVYHFITAQANFLSEHKKEHLFFVNILDGDTCFSTMGKFIYLISKPIYKDIKKNIFIGSLHEFQNWFISHHFEVL